MKKCIAEDNNNISTKVSIIVPIYNSEKYLQNCIKSILEQSYQNIELLLINDGSTDYSEEICKKFLLIDNRIKYYYQSNSGVSYARNNGLLNATGDYVMFVDSDDTINQFMVEFLLRERDISDADMVIAGISRKHLNNVIEDYILDTYIDGHGAIATFFAQNFLNSITSSTVSKLYKRKLITDFFDTSITMGEDLLFNLEYIKKINSVKVVNKSLYIYDCTNQNSLVHNYKSDYFYQDVYVCKRWKDWLLKSNVNSKYITNIDKKYWTLFLTIVYELINNKTMVEINSVFFNTIDEDFICSIPRVLNAFNVGQRLILKSLYRKNFFWSVFLIRIYRSLQSLKRFCW